MDKFRRDIHGVLARQQSGLGSTAGASDRLLRQALAPAEVRRHFVPQLAAALATLLVGAAIAYTVIVTRGHLHSQNPVTRVSPTAQPTPPTTPSTTPVPSPTALAQPLPVPSSTPVVLYVDPVNPQQVDGVTWDGVRRGVIGAASAMGLQANPAGTLYMAYPDIRNRSGQTVSQIVGHAKISTMWADDGSHYCQVTSPSDLPPAGGEPATLRLVTLAGSVRNVAQIGTMYQQSGAGVAACSIGRDRAVVTQSSGMGNTVKFWVVQLSTGRILWSRTPANGTISVSRDAQYIADTPAYGASGASTIYSANGAVVGHVAGPVMDFSWDGNLAVVGPWGGASSVVRWRDGKVLWTAPAGSTFSGSLPEAGGSRVAVEVQTPGHPQTGGYSTVDVYAVSPDGTGVQILSSVSL